MAKTDHLVCKDLHLHMVPRTSMEETVASRKTVLQGVPKKLHTVCLAIVEQPSFNYLRFSQLHRSSFDLVFNTYFLSPSDSWLLICGRKKARLAVAFQKQHSYCSPAMPK